MARAEVFLTGALEQPGLRQNAHFDWFVPEAARITATTGDPTLLARLTDMAAADRALRPCVEPSVRAIVAERAGDLASAATLYAHAAAGWSRLGVPYEHALSMLGQARCFVERGEAAPARNVLREAEHLLRPLEARPALDEVLALLDEAGTAVT